MRNDPFRGMGIAARLKGLVRLEIRGAWPEAVLNACTRESIRVYDVERPDEYTLLLTAAEKEAAGLQLLSERCQCDSRIVAHRGGRRGRARLLRRRSVLLLAFLLAAILFFSSLFIWQIDIVGAQSLSRGEVLRALDECGIRPGTYWPALSTDELRSGMLLRLPALSWMTIRVRGSRATVLLVERPQLPETDGEEETVLVASRSGIVTGVSVLRGRALVEPGSCVEAGEVLVSGRLYGLGAASEGVAAKGTVMAETWYERTALCPLEQAGKGETGKRRTRLALRIAGRRINFYIGSGKPIDGCDKIVHDTALGIDGLFCLPLSLIREDCVCRPERDAAEDPAEAMQRRLYEALAAEIRGEILSAEYSVSRRNGLLAVTMRAHCLEDIARTAASTDP